MASEFSARIERRKIKMRRVRTFLCSFVWIGTTYAFDKSSWQNNRRRKDVDERNLQRATKIIRRPVINQMDAFSVLSYRYLLLSTCTISS